MKPIEEWKRLLANINFPNFKKSDNKEMMDFIFTNCKQRDALLTWVLLQLGADCVSNRVLEHSAIVDYLKQRKVLEESKVEDFVKATLSEEQQEHQWDKIFNFIEMHKHLFPQPHHYFRDLELSDKIEDVSLNEQYKGFSGAPYLEPLYKELEAFQKIRKLQKSDMDVAESSKDHEEGSEGTSESHIKISDPDNLENSEEIRSDNKPKSDLGEENKKRKNPIKTSQTTSGTWYSTPDEYDKVFVPVGAPPLGEMKFDMKNIKIVCEDSSSEDETPEQQAKLAEKLKAFYKSFKMTV